MSKKNKPKLFWYFMPLLVFVILAVAAPFVYTAYVKKVLNNAPKTTPTTANPTITPKQTTPAPAAKSAYYFPITDFDSRIIYRWFGKYVNSSDKVPYCGAVFNGYHNGDDLEPTASEQSADVPFYSVADGTIRQASYVSGYGGLLVLGTSINGQDVTVYYGHIRLSSALPAGTQVKAGQKLAVLGTGCSTETDGERKHLHFAIHKGSAIDVRGYVSNTSALSAWLDPKAMLDLLSPNSPK